MSNKTEESYPDNPIDAIYDQIRLYTEMWVNKMTRENIADQVNRILDESSKKAVLKLLGFDVTYGQDWKLDHCNGRSGNSTAGDYIREVQGETVKRWLATVEMPEIPPELAKHLRDTAYQTYHKELTKAVTTLAYQAAEVEARKIMDSLKRETHFTKHQLAIQLIAPIKEA